LLIGKRSRKGRNDDLENNKLYRRQETGQWKEITG
jgi:hypothetical protein